MSLAEEVYRHSRAFPQEERYGLTSQMRRAAVSIPSNIAEGQGRATRGEFLQFLGQARGSLYELATQATLANRLLMLSDESYQALMARISKVGQLLNGLIAKLKSTRT